MTGHPPLAGARLLASIACGLSFLSVCDAGRAQTPAAQESFTVRADDRRFTFDIPAQPLDMALERFSTVSGRSALFSSALVAGRTASPVSGRYTALEALRRLVDGTGLAVEAASSADATTFVLVPATTPTSAGEASENETASRLAGYDALVQSEVWRAICADSRTSKTRYRALLRFRVTADARVVDVRVLSETGEMPVGRALVDALSHVHISQPPSPDMPQPFAMLILPESRGGASCRAGVGPS